MIMTGIPDLRRYINRYHVSLLVTRETAPHRTPPSHILRTIINAVDVVGVVHLLWFFALNRKKIFCRMGIKTIIIIRATGYFFPVIYIHLVGLTWLLLNDLTLKTAKKPLHRRGNHDSDYQRFLQISPPIELLNQWNGMLWGVNKILKGMRERCRIEWEICGAVKSEVLSFIPGSSQLFSHPQSRKSNIAVIPMVCVLFIVFEIDVVAGSNEHDKYFANFLFKLAQFA